jgi:hypothetical protein
MAVESKAAKSSEAVTRSSQVTDALHPSGTLVNRHATLGEAGFVEKRLFSARNL